MSIIQAPDPTNQTAFANGANGVGGWTCQALVPGAPAITYATSVQTGAAGSAGNPNVGNVNSNVQTNNPATVPNCFG